MEKIVFCEVTWMKYYHGVSEDDKPKNGGKYIKENNFGGEVYNYDPYNHKCYGYVMHKGEELHIERYDKILKSFDEVRDMTVVWVASDGKSSKIVGWYEHATMYRDWQYFRDEMYSGDMDYYYNFIADEKNCYLIDEKDRNFVIPRASVAGKGRGMGQSQIWYADSEYAQKEFVPQVLEYLETMKEKCISFYHTLEDFSVRATDCGETVEELIDKSIASYSDANSSLQETFGFINLAIDKSDCFETRALRADLFSQIGWYDEAEEEYKVAMHYKEDIDSMRRFMYVELLMNHTFIAIELGEKIRARKSEDSIWETTANNLALAYVFENEFDAAKNLIAECENDSDREYDWIEEVRKLMEERIKER